MWWCWVTAWLTWQRCMSAGYVTPCRLFFLALGGVIAYISSSSSASSPASCHSESSDSGFQSSSSPVPSPPNSSSSESGCNGRSSEGSDGAPKSDRLEETIKTNQSSVAGLTKGHNGVTSMFGASSCKHRFPLSYHSQVPLWLVVQAHSKASIFIFWHCMCGNTYGVAIQMLIRWGSHCCQLQTVHKYSPALLQIFISESGS